MSNAHERKAIRRSAGNPSTFTVSSLFFPVIVSPALLQSHRNQIQAAAPFPRKNEEDVRASIF
jgi:hypothetical protein